MKCKRDKTRKRISVGFTLFSCEKASGSKMQAFSGHIPHSWPQWTSLGGALSQTVSPVPPE